MAAATQQAPSTLYLHKAREAANVKDCMDIYDKWAATYDAEVTDKDQNYVAPTLVAQLASKASTDPTNAIILDAGCGTGLVGQALSSVGAKAIDGLDFSAAMLDVAKRTGLYRSLYQADMNKQLEQKDNTYDIVTCVGTFTSGHVGPDPGLRELVRITKKNGVVVATILEEIWLTKGFKAEVDKLVAEKQITLVAAELLDYVKGHGDKAIFAVLRKN